MATALVALATTTLASSSATVTFSSISGSYRDLVLITQASATSGAVNFYIRFNSDTGANYNWVGMGGTGSSALSNSGASQTTGALDYYGYLDSGIANNQVSIFDYVATDKHKTWLARPNNAGNGTSAIAGRWASTSAITSITLFPSSSTFTAGSTFSLYGIVS